MKVVHICPTYFSPDSVIAGAERYTFELAKAMSKQVSTKLLTFGPQAFRRQEGALEIECVKTWFYIRKNPMNPFAPQFLAKLRGYDVIHCHQYCTIPTDLAIFYAKLFRKKVFVTDLAGHTNISFSNYLPSWKWVNGFLLISDFNRVALAPRYQAPMTTIHGGVDLEKFKPDARARESFFLFVGRITPHKGLEVLFEALDPDMELQIIGTCSDAKYLAQLKELARGKKVLFCDKINDEELACKYQSARAVVLPSILEGGYTTAMEALASGTPVISSAVGSLKEIVKDRETGFLIPPSDVGALRDRLRYFCTQPSEVGVMGERGLADMKSRYTWELTVQRCLEAYSK